MLDVEKLIDGIHEYIERALKPLAERVKAVEGRPAPKDGTSVTLDDVRPVIEEAVKAIPIPKDGKDGESVTIEDVMPALSEVAAEAAQKAVASIPLPKDGKDGESVTLDDVRPLIEEAVKSIPPPKDGAPGKDGTSVTIEDVLQDVLPIIHEAVKSIPAPKDGADGKDGEPGKDGSSVVLDDVLPALREDVQKAIEALPVPKDGRDGKDGKDGKSVTADDFRQMFEAEQAKWALDFERRANDLLQRAVENMPKPKDGKDGLGFDDLAVEDNGEGNVTIKFQRGEVVKEFNLHFPCFKYRGVWTEQAYREGDGVTFGGSLWLAKKESPEGKPGQSDDWQLAVKKGRDGKDGKDGVMVEQPTKPVIKVPPR